MIKSKTQGGSILARWGIWAGEHPGRVFLIVLVITVVMTVGASMLEMEMTFFSIMPKNSQQVKDLKLITEEYPFASSLVVVIDGRELPAETAKSTVIAVIDRMTEEFSGDEYSSAISGVYGKLDTAFLDEHAFLLTEPDVLDRMRSLYADTDLLPFFTALNDDLEREYSGDGDAMESDENQIAAWVGGIGLILDGLADSLEGDPPDEKAIKAALDAYLIGGNPHLGNLV